MCGIVGLVAIGCDEAIDPAQLRRMRDVITHRGPDGEGLWTDGPVGFGHRRLAIVDVAGGHQPMSNEDGTAWITFNGEIYNHNDLRPSLIARGHQYRTRCDTETIVHLFEDEGERAVEQLHGMFAFAIWDRTKRRLLLARDRLGIKPLYYAVTSRHLIFGSEIKAVLASGLVKPELNAAAVPELLATRFVSGDETLFRGIRKLLPGHTLTWSAEEGVRTRRYWQLPHRTAATTPAGDFQDQVAMLRTRLDASVQRHLMSDVPLGMFLSAASIRVCWRQSPHDTSTARFRPSPSGSPNRKRTSSRTRGRWRRRLARIIVRSSCRPTTTSTRCRISSGRKTSRLPSRRASRSISCRSWRASTSRSC